MDYTCLMAQIERASQKIAVTELVDAPVVGAEERAHFVRHLEKVHSDMKAGEFTDYRPGGFLRAFRKKKAPKVSV